MQNGKLRICHVITRMIVGGAQENTLLTIRGHLAAGHQVELVTGPSPGREGKLLENSGMPDFPTIEIPDMVREVSLLHDVKAFFALKKFFKAGNFDVVHTHSSKAGIIGRLAARAAKVPVVVHTVHGQAFHPYQNKWKNRLFIALERFAAHYCDKIYAVAQAMIDQCVAAKVAPREKYQVVYSGMETSAFANSIRETDLRTKLGIPENAFTVAVIARLFPQKGYEFVIPAAEKLLKKYPDCHFLLIGDGPMFDELQIELKKRNMDKCFHFAGLVPPDEVCRYLAQADLLWHLSLHEGLPRAVVQALASAIPAIGFHLDGTPEVVLNGKTGFTVQPGDIDGVAEKSAEIIADPDFARELGRNGQKLVLEQFDWRKMAEILEEEYLQLFSKNKKI